LPTNCMCPVTSLLRPDRPQNRQLQGLTIMVNSLFNGWRMEDVWLEKTPTPASTAEEPSRPAPAEKPALVPPSMPSGAGAAPPEPPALSTAASGSRATIADNPPKSPNPNGCNKHSNQKNESSPQVKPRQ